MSAPPSVDTPSLAEKGSVHHFDSAPSGKAPRLDAIAEDEEVNRILANSGGQSHWTEDEERRLVRKLDMILLPVMAFTITLQTTDKGVYGSACVFGMCSQLGLYQPSINAAGQAINNTSRYSFASTIFYIGYLAGVYPLAFLAQRFRIAKMTGLYTLIWGIVLLMSIVVKDYKGAYAQRFCLGLFEAGVSPAFTLITSMFYTKKEQSSRLPYWYASGFVGLAIFQIVTWGIVHIETGFPKWKIIFLFYGFITIAWAGIAITVLPDSPATCRWFNDREKYIAIERLRANQDSIKSSHINTRQILEAVLDIRVWLIVIITFLVLVPNGLTSTFIPVVVRGLGYSSYDSLLLSAPAFLVSGLSGIGCGYASSKFRNSRAICTMITLLPCLIGCILLWKVPKTNIGAALAGIYMNSTFAGALSQIQAFIPSNTAGTTKKTFSAAAAFMAYAVGNILGPLLLKGHEAPVYPTGFKAFTTCISICIGMLGVYRVVCQLENRRRDKLGDEAHSDHAFENQTDKQNLSCRYAL